MRTKLTKTQTTQVKTKTTLIVMNKIILKKNNNNKTIKNFVIKIYDKTFANYNDNI